MHRCRWRVKRLSPHGRVILDLRIYRGGWVFVQVGRYVLTNGW